MTMTGSYSIKDLENFTQIKAHTIRIWEQRYELLTPNRTKTNIRYYDEADLKKILNIKLLNQDGLKISKIASLNEEQIIERAKTIILGEQENKQSQFNELILWILEFDEQNISNFLKTKLKESSVFEIYENTILPLLHKIGELWQVNTVEVIHEHFFSNLFRSFMLTQIELLDVLPDKDKRAMLFLHQDEEHEFSLLLYYYLLKKNGYRCCYFGQKVPLKDLKKVSWQLKPNLIVSTFVAQLNEKEFSEIQSHLLQLHPKAEIIVSGNQLHYFEDSISNKITYIKNLNQLKKWITTTQSQ